MKLNNFLISYNLRIVFPVIVSFLLMINFIFSSIFEYNDHIRIVKEGKRTEIENYMNLLIDVVEFNTNNNSPGQIDSFVSNISMDSQVLNLIIFSEDGIIKHSNHKINIGENFYDLEADDYSGPKTPMTLINRDENNKFQINIVEFENKIIVYSAISAQIKKNELRDLSTLSIYFEYSLSNLISKEVDSIVRKTWMSFVKVFLTYLLLYFVFKQLISLRLQALLNIMEKAKSGNLQSKFTVLGNDEIASISRSYITLTEKLEKLLYFDSITGVYNRFAFEIYTTNQLSTTKMHRGLVLIDLDDFKEINDTYGHQFGDEILKKYAANIEAYLSLDESIARIGGDEFLILTGEFERIEDLEKYISGLYEHLKTEIIHKGNIIEVRATLGVSVYPDHGTDFKSLLINTDIAIFNAKKEGKNKFLLIDEKVVSKTNRKNQILAILKNSNFDQEFQLYYQPILSVKTNMICGLEALLRWNSKEMGYVPPDELIPIMEESGMVKELGRWVIRTVIAQQIDWMKRDIPVVTVNVNVSFQEFSQKDYVFFLESYLFKHKFDPKLIKLEITESEIMKNLDMTMINLNQIRNMGVGLAIDDFGTGYSSLSYLKNLPITHIKIDKSFITDVPRDVNDNHLVQTILKLAMNLGFETVAEGVESIEQYEFLLENGCDTIQGYLFSRPVPAQQLEPLLKEYVNNPYQFKK